MFTPQEVSKKTFPETRKHGYDMVSVDEFLDTLTEDYTALYKENAALKTKLKVLAEKVEEYRATEDAMRSTLLTAQKMAARLVQEAQTEKDAILAEARVQAAKEIAVLDTQKREAELKLSMAQQQLSDFIARSADLCEQQSAFLRTLPELELAVQDEAEDDKAAAAQAIEQEITKEFDPVREAAEAEEPAGTPQAEETPAPAGESAGEDAAMDFKLSLNELKFGRNYGSDH